MLPYLVCAAFKPAIRRRDHFVNIEYFMVDVDHVSEHYDIAQLSLQLAADTRLVLLFTSPGGDGLKLLFRLQEKCSDYGLFSAFYKQFIQQLATTYHLHPVIDISTSDVTRACFISYDEHAYYNPDAQKIDMMMYHIDDTEQLWSEAQQAETSFVAEKEKFSSADKPKQKPGPAQDVMESIRQKLNPLYRKPEKKQYYIPPEADAFLEKLKEELVPYGLQLLETAPIHYGRKLKIGAGNLWAEINLFYGGRGFTFVKTTKTGSDGELATICVQVLEETLQRIQNHS